jgi:hypothetical protein
VRTLLCLVFACAHAAAVAAVAATPVDRARGEEIRSDIAGEYRLETGRSVRLSLLDGTLYIDLDNAHRRALYPVAPNLLASRDGALTVQYMPDGETERILIRHERYPADRRIGIYRMFGR